MAKATDTVVWTNVNWDSATLEIRKGNDSNPANNPVVATPTLGKTEKHIETSEGIDFWWLRTLPSQSGGYNHRPCYGLGQTYNETV